MADLVAADVTVTVEDRQIVGKTKRNRVKIVFGDGALTYPSGGVPMPGASKFGMVRNLDYLILFDTDSAVGLLWKYDKVNKKFRGYWPTGGGATAPVAAETAPVSGAPTLTGADSTALTTHTHSIAPGQAKEFVAATTTIAATTMFAEAVGW